MSAIVLRVETIRSGVEADFVRGDATADGFHSLSDILFIADHLFVPGSAAPSCPTALDANGDSVLDISDSLYLILYLFLMGSEPPAPFPNCASGFVDACLPCPNFEPCN